MRPRSRVASNRRIDRHVVPCARAHGVWQTRPMSVPPMAARAADEVKGSPTRSADGVNDTIERNGRKEGVHTNLW